MIDQDATRPGKFLRRIFYVSEKQSLYVLGNKGMLMKKSKVNAIPQLHDPDYQFSIYPNPCKDILTIQLINNRSVKENITIVNLLGVKVKELTGTGPKLQLDIRDLPEGIYFVFLTDGESRYSGKVIILR